MATFPLLAGDLAYWFRGDQEVVPVKVELVTRDRVYFMGTGDSPHLARGRYWYEGRDSRRVAPRGAVYTRHRNGKLHGYVDWKTIAVVG